MSESAISSRSLSGAEEFDRRMRSIAQSSAAHSQALEELARLVGEQDPFGDARHADHHEPAPAADDIVSHPPADYLRSHAPYGGALDQGADAGSPTEPAIMPPPLSPPEAWERAVPRYPSISVNDLRPVETSPDAWAQGAAEETIGPMPVADVREEPRLPPESSHAKRTLMVLAAVTVLTGGGLAAALLKHPSATGALVDSATATPTILAATGPSKVQLETAPAADAPSEPSTLLDKNKNDGTAAAKVVNSVEQPVDLGQAMKPAASQPAAEPSAPPSPFPEPRKVKTILVRPDGSIIADAVAPTAEQPSAASQQADLAFDPKTAIPIPATRSAEATPDTGSLPPDAAAPAAEKPQAGKTTARVPAAKPAASTSQGGSAAAEGRTPVATPKAKPVAHVAKPKPKPAAVVAEAAPAAAAPDTGPPTLVQYPPAPAPAAVADATPAAPAVSGQGGSFAVQLGATPSEAEGQATATRLSQKYAGDLGGAKASVHKAAAAGKTVFRIRVGNLSQDEAKALCGKVQAGGGACFVARN